MVVLVAPLLGEDLHLPEGIEELPVQEFVPKLAVEALNIPILPLRWGLLPAPARVEALGSDPDLANNDASQDTVVAPKADLSLTNTDSPDPVLVGRSVTYTLTATNSGPSRGNGSDSNGYAAR